MSIRQTSPKRHRPVTEANLQSSWTAIDSDSPSGANLEYDVRFVEMMRMSEGTREQQFGDTIIAAQPPEWRSVRQLALQLAEQTRDLRIAVMLVEAMTHERGLEGLADAMQLLQHWVCDLWPTVHPQLDADDAGDPFVRINCLGRLCEAERLPSLIGKVAVVEAPPHVVVTVDDLPTRRGTVSAVKPDRPTTMEVEAAFLSLKLADLRQLFETCGRIEAALDATVQFLNQEVSAGVWDVGILQDRIAGCTAAVKAQLRARLASCDSVVAEVGRGSAAGTADDSPGDPWSLDRPISSVSRIRVESREDASEVIEAAMKYFEQHEPSSPVPLLLRRARRLINQGFVDIIRDLAPDALAHAISLAGDVDD